MATPDERAKLSWARAKEKSTNDWGGKMQDH